MIRRINRTGRKRILKQDISLELRTTEAGEAVFDLELHLANYGFPEDAHVRVEASRVHAVQRWNYGTAGDLRPPPEEDRRLTEVPPSARFRVFVAEDGSGKFLGLSSNLTPERDLTLERPRSSLLPLEERDDLGEVVWCVDFDGEDANPVLLVNQNVAGISEVVRQDPTFRSLVMPEVFRVILTRMVLIDRAPPDDKEGPWADWFEVARSYLPTEKRPSLSPESDDGGEIEDARRWIDAVVGALAERPLSAATTFGGARS